MKKLILYSLFVISLLGCDDAPFLSPQASFTRLYNDASSNKDYHPVAIHQTIDGGYLILSAYDDWQVYVMKINSQGRFVWDRLLDNLWINPVGHFLPMQDGLFFMCMQRGSREATLMQVDEIEPQISEFARYSGLFNPLDAKPSAAGGAIVLSYQSAVDAMGFSLIGPDFNQAWGRLFPNEANVNTLMDNHMRNRVERLPFFAGELGGGNGFFFNGFTDNALSLTFTNSTVGELTGRLEGQGLEVGMAGLLPIGANTFVSAHFSLNNYSLNGEQTLNPNISTSVNTLPGRRFPDLAVGRPSPMALIPYEGGQLVCVASQTRDLRVRMAFFNANNGSSAGFDVLGFGNPLDIVDIKPTRDGGLIMLGSSSISGRLKRLYVVKMAKEEIDAIVNGR
jgi:hypothetical protein